MEKCDCEIVKPMPGGHGYLLERKIFSSCSGVRGGSFACFWIGFVVKVKVAAILF